MAFSMGSGNGGGLRKSRFRGTGSLSEINIVPLVDVMMVLLVIFMLTAHVMEFGMEVDVPKVKTVKDTAEEMPVVNITKNGVLYLGDAGVNINELSTAIHQRYGNNIRGVFVRADKDAIFDVFAQVVAELNDHNIAVRVVTQPLDEADRPKKR